MSESRICHIHLDFMESITRFLSINEIVMLFMTNKYYRSHLKYILSYSVSNKYVISLEVLESSSFNLALIENHSVNAKLYYEIDTSEYSIKSTLKILYIYAKNTGNTLKILDYIDMY